MTQSPVAEEAGKLVEALVDWARSRGLPTGLAGAVGGHLSDRMGGSQECTLCPLCQLIALGRTASPEAFEHLAAAATSLLAAVSAVAAQQAGAAPRPPVQHIDLDR